jgi:hypothetical protein
MMRRVGTLRVVISVAMFALCAAGVCHGADAYLPPAGGYLYSFEANAGQDSPGTSGAAYDALDGTFGYGNNSDTWDGSKIGAGEGKPGGVIIVDGKYLRLQDPGDPRDYALGPDPTNRKIFLAHKTTANGASPTILNDGATLHIRVRIPTGAPIDDLHPDGGSGIVPYPATGDGYRIHDGGKGNIAFHQASGGLISFTLAIAGEHAEITESGLITNHLNGTAASADVDTGDPGTPNSLALDPTQWHEFWITIEAGGTGTHIVTIYMDGNTNPAATFDVTAGAGDDIGDGYLGFGLGSTALSGALDIDFARIADGAQAPTAPKVVPAVGGPGLLFIAAAVLLLGAILIFRRKVALA